jgi:hypothetical protein
VVIDSFNESDRVGLRLGPERMPSPFIPDWIGIPMELLELHSVGFRHGRVRPMWRETLERGDGCDGLAQG